MSDDKIIRFPGPGQAGAATAGAAAPATGSGSRTRARAATVAEAAAALTDEQRKAVEIILSGMSFVLVGIKPTQTGADFFTAVSGDHAELRNAQDHLGGVIERAFHRRGVTSQ